MKNLKILAISFVLLLGASISMANPEYANANIGTVAETMTSGGYVYVRLEEDDSWLASTEIPLTVGDKVRYSSGMVMPNFTSPSLKRTFSSIRFVERLEVIGQMSADAHADAAASDMHGFAKSAKAEAPVAGEIEALNGGKTVAAVIADAEQLKDQEISLRAKVMKVNENILGKNWITLQDGTGEAPENKLVATSEELAEIGSVVVVKGVVKTDVDLGMGYKYKVILESASFSK